MHESALSLGKLFFDTYLQHHISPTVIDVGAADVNGSLRNVAPVNSHYFGVDMAPSRGVDIVLSDPYVLPFEDGTADAVVSSSCFEHAEHFWLLFAEIQRVLKPDGIFYLNAPSNGVVHRFPMDCWRFYPDSGAALASWGQKLGYSTMLLEAFVASRVRDHWNDFVAVFLQNERHLAHHTNRMSAHLDVVYNVMRTEMDGSMTRLKSNELTEDMLIQQNYMEKMRILAQRLAQAEQEILNLQAQLETVKVAPRV